MVSHDFRHDLFLVGPLAILATTAYFASDGEAHYDIATGPASAATSSGLTITASLSFEDVLSDPDNIDTLMIAGGHGSSNALKDPALLSFLRAAAPRARRIASICTGALVLAEAGLLNGKRASTHWFWCPKMESDSPEIQVDRDA